MTRLDKIVTLTNGLRVGNFSSPHDFIFTDGTILNAVSNETAENLKVNFHEVTEPNSSQQPNGNYKGWWDVALDFHLTPEIRSEIDQWVDIQSKKQVDIVLIPLPMLTAMKNDNRLHTFYELKRLPFRCIRIEDRINKLVSTEKFCI
jgi:hypothetical protein